MVWYENEVQRLEKERTLLAYDPKLLFYGSSSIRLWESLMEDFAPWLPANLGFGGSTLRGDAPPPKEVFFFFPQLSTRPRQRFGDIPLAFISIKPSITRWNIVDSIRYTNRIIEEEINRQGNNLHFINVYNKMTDNSGYPKREFLDPDGLHINDKGYALWKEIILQYLSARTP